jgi:heptaprenyl diphosphate synthase
MKLSMLYSDMRSDLDLIEKELEVAVNSSSHLLNDASLHLLHAGGKRIRPVFVLLAAKFGDYQIDLIKDVAVPLELIHMASLVHDDVIDNSEMRRGQLTVKAQWNNRVAMYTGDFIFARALEYITNFSNTETHRILSYTMVEICVGEIIQIEDKYKLDQRLQDYFRRIKRKTALLISSSCQLGAVISGADDKTTMHLKRFGYYVGMSFQIIDDILDFTSTDKELGKPAGSDLLQGNITLPILFLKDDPTFRKDFERAMSGELTEEERLELVKRVRQSDAIDKAKLISDRYLQKAMRELDVLPDLHAKDFTQNFAFHGET